MYERSLNEAELILSAQKNSILPVQIVWEEVVKRSKKSGFEVASLPDFSAMLEGDKRFQIIPAHNKEQDEEEILDNEYVDSEMEKLGFYPEDRVKLRDSQITGNIESEDDEEIGSIKRKAFITMVTKLKGNVKKKKKTSITKKVKADKGTKRGKKLSLRRKKIKNVKRKKKK